MFSNLLNFKSFLRIGI